MTKRFALPSFVLLACAAGCEPTPPSAPAPSSAAAPASDQVEQARVAQYLASLYRPSDVRYTFRDARDQPVDCIDFAAQPGVRALVAAGQPVPEQKPPTLPPEAAARLRSRAFTADDVDLDRDGNPRICPDGTVPQPRLTPEHIRAVGGLDAYRRVIERRKPAPPTPGHSSVCDFPNYAHVIGAVGDDGSQVYMGDSTTSIYAPGPIPAGDHSLSQTWTYSGANSCDGVTSNVQSVETGWLVDVEVNQGDANPHLFIYSTTDGYHQTGCYNGASGSNCTTWINTSSRYYPGYPLPVSVEGGTRHERLLTANFGNWWIQIDVDGVSDYMGYYVASAFHGTMQTYADSFEAGGEIYDGSAQFLLPMGSGAWPTTGLADAAYHHDVWGYGFEDGTDKTIWDALTPVTARPNSYSYSSAPAGVSGWENYFYFGNTFHLIWYPPIPIHLNEQR